MKHTEILKQAFRITWRYRPLWLFGFLLALCDVGGNSNFNLPDIGEGNFDNLPNVPDMPNIDPNIWIALGVGLFCLVVLLVAVGIVVQYVARTALIGMVQQIKETEMVTIRDGWKFGWSRRAWRSFLLGLLIGIPAAILTIVLILLALSPLLLFMLDNTASSVLGLILTAFACILVFILLFIVGVIIAPIQELAWRGIALDQQGVIDSLGQTINLIKRRFRDVAIMWLLMFGVILAWGIVTLLVVLPVSLIAAILVGGIPAGLVYLLSQSGWGAIIAGAPLALLVLILISSTAHGLYLIYQSAAWTLAYLELQKPGLSPPRIPDSPQPPEKTDTPNPDPPVSDLALQV